MKLALALICKADNKEASDLNRCLSSVSKFVDGIFVTITGENTKCENVADLYKANISHFDWINDFAAARNFNFAQVPKEYTHILWMDTDDLIKNGEKIKKVVESNPMV